MTLRIPAALVAPVLTHPATGADNHAPTPLPADLFTFIRPR